MTRGSTRASRLAAIGPVGWMAGAALLLAVPCLGCATSGRVTTLEQRVQTLESRVDAVDRKADQAESRAESAEKSAQQAADRADDAARTSEAIFKKHVSK
jgi:outer membrane murein-binding lipoprotein Lpp